MNYQLFSKFPGRMLIILLHTDSQNAWKRAKEAINAVLFKACFLNPLMHPKDEKPMQAPSKKMKLDM